MMVVSPYDERPTEFLEWVFYHVPEGLSHSGRFGYIHGVNNKK